MLFTRNYRNQFMLVETTACQSWLVYETQFIYTMCTISILYIYILQQPLNAVHRINEYELVPNVCLWLKVGLIPCMTKRILVLCVIRFTVPVFT